MPQAHLHDHEVEAPDSGEADGEGEVAGAHSASGLLVADALLAGLLGQHLEVRNGAGLLLLRLKDSHASIFNRYRFKDKRDFLR
ncbi:hypothetical protein GCM10020216_077800 [Nonomuraea helvata]